MSNLQLAQTAWNNWQWSREYPVRGVSYIKDSVKTDFKQAVRIVKQLRNEAEQLSLF